MRPSAAPRSCSCRLRERRELRGDFAIGPFARLVHFGELRLHPGQRVAERLEQLAGVLQEVLAVFAERRAREGLERVPELHVARGERLALFLDRALRRVAFGLESRRVADERLAIAQPQQPNGRGAGEKREESNER